VIVAFYGDTKVILILLSRLQHSRTRPSDVVGLFVTVARIALAGRRPPRSHSNDIRKLIVPRTHNELGDRSFLAAGPRLWNDLPPGLRWPGLSFDSFRRSLKTHLFWQLKRLVTLSTYRRYTNNCIYLSIYLSLAIVNLTVRGL